MTTATPTRTIATDRTTFRPSPVMIATEAAIIGVIRGATIIAPMITALEFPRSPPAAMIVERTSRMKNRA